MEDESSDIEIVDDAEEADGSDNEQGDYITEEEAIQYTIITLREEIVKKKVVEVKLVKMEVKLEVVDKEREGESENETMRRKGKKWRAIMDWARDYEGLEASQHTMKDMMDEEVRNLIEKLVEGQGPKAEDEDIEERKYQVRAGALQGLEKEMNEIKEQLALLVVAMGVGIMEEQARVKKTISARKGRADKEKRKEKELKRIEVKKKEVETEKLREVAA
ncbi:hypothetical protein BGX38DRAFT_1272170 [Terfezia claveryi]|nr:hypothetical protein BGX38DRAFT_1272170 [Terfezia claveryi]